METIGVFTRGRRIVLNLTAIVVTVLLTVSAGAAKNLGLAWDASPDSEVTGYAIYYGVASRNYPNVVQVGNVTSVVISNLQEGVTYYFAATSRGSSGLESDYSSEISYTVPVSTVNAQPTLNAIGNVTVSEDANAQTVNLSGISSGSANESQALTITATSSNPNVVPHPVVNYSSPNSTGSLGFTPVANANGSATITVTVNDGQAQNNTVTRTFTVTVNAVNDAPTLNAIGNVTVSEDANAQTVNLSGISSGSANESQALTITATSSNPNVVPHPIVNYSSPNSTGSLGFTPVANANGSATITVTVNDGQAQNNTVTRTFTVTVNPVNDAPTLNAIGNVSVAENSGAQAVSLSGISSGAANESQTLIVTATSSNPGVVPHPSITYTSPNSTGSLAFTPAANASGSAMITVTVNDGQAQNGTVVRTFLVTVTDVINVQPTLNSIGNVTLNEDASAQTINLGGIGSGSADEVQTLVVTATSSNPALVPNPIVNYSSPSTTGTLSVAPAANANGSATITVTVNDGQAQNNIFTRTFTVTVNAVNDAPGLNALSNRTINEDAGTQIVNLSGISSGAANESQTLSVTAVSSNPSLIPDPAVTYSSPGTTGSLAFTPVANASGSATITVTVNDGQSQNSTISRTFTVTVNEVNDPPTLNALSDMVFAAQSPSGATPRTVNLSGITSGANNENQLIIVSATSSNPSFIPHPTVNYVSPNATGSLTFTPVANVAGSASIAVQVSDGQSQVSRSFTVTISAGNQPPVISDISSRATTPGTSTPPIPFVIGDLETAASNLTVRALSSNTLLVPTNQVVFGGQNSNRTVQVTPAPGRTGDADITVEVSDGNLVANTTFRLTVSGSTGNPSMLTLVTNGNGTIVGTPMAQSLKAGQRFQFMARPGPGQMFAGWSGATNTTSQMLYIESGPNVVVQANFVPLNLTETGEGIILPDLRKYPNLAPGRVYTMTAMGGPGQIFTGWTGSTNSASPTLRFVMQTNLNLKANFVPLKLTMNGDGAAFPDLTKTPNLIPGRVYTVTARGGPGQIFTGWTGSTNSASPTLRFVMQTNVSLQANFTPFKLTVIGNGRVYPDLTKIPNLIPDRPYVMVAAPGIGQEFAGWSGSVNSMETTLRVNMTTNLSLRANFIPSPYIPIAGSYNGLFFENEEVRQHSAGFFTVTVASRGTYSGWLQMGAARYPFYGKLGLNLQATNVIVRARTTPLTLHLRFGTGNEIDQLTGQVSDGTWTAGLMGDRAIFNVRTNPAPQAGAYTLVLPGQNSNAKAPAGDGYGLARVLTSGLTMVNGTLADGTPFFQSTYLSKHGYWPFYAAPPGQSLLGWLSFTNQPADDVSGTVNWIKNPAAYGYKAGFTTEFKAIGSRFQVPANYLTTPVLGFTNGVFEFSGGSIASDFANLFQFGNVSSIKNLSSNQMFASISFATGLMNGWVTDPETGARYTFRGVALQKQKTAHGFLLATDQSGRVLVRSNE